MKVAGVPIHTKGFDDVVIVRAGAPPMAIEQIRNSAKARGKSVNIVIVEAPSGMRTDEIPIDYES